MQRRTGYRFFGDSRHLEQEKNTLREKGDVHRVHKSSIASGSYDICTANVTTTSNKRHN